MKQSEIKLPQDRINTDDLSIDIDTDPEEYNNPAEDAANLFNSTNDRLSSIPLGSLTSLETSFIFRSKTEHIVLLTSTNTLSQDYLDDIVVYKEGKFIGHLLEVIGKEESPLFVVWFDKQLKDEIKEGVILKPYLVPE